MLTLHSARPRANVRHVGSAGDAPPERRTRGDTSAGVTSSISGDAWPRGVTRAALATSWAKRPHHTRPGVSSPRGRRATPWGATGLAVSSQHATVSRTVARLDPPRGSGRPASQPRSTCAPGGKHTSRHPVPRCPTPRARERGRPGQGAHPDHGLSHLDGALAAAVARREAWVAQPRGGSVAPQARADTPWAPAAWLTGATGQQQAERGWRCRTGPPLWAAARSLNTPERRMALWLGMTVGVFGEAALESRLRTALTDHAATVPTQQGQAVPHLPMRWVWHDCVERHRLLRPGHGPHVWNRTQEPHHLRQLLGQPSGRFDSSIFTNMRGAMRNVSWNARPS